MRIFWKDETKALEEWEQAIFQVTGAPGSEGTSGECAQGYMFLTGEVMLQAKLNTKDKHQSSIMHCSLKEKNITYESKGKHPHAGILIVSVTTILVLSIVLTIAPIV